MPGEAPSAVSAARILHIDDDAKLAQSVARILRMNGYAHLEHCGDPEEAIERIASFSADVVLLDLVMPGARGQDVLQEIRLRHPTVGVIILTAEYDPQAAVECMRLGARDFVQKPARAAQVIASIERVLEESALSYEAAQLRAGFFSAELKNPEAFEEIVTRDEKMQRVFAYIEAVARGSQPLLIRGETGTGKEMIAKAVHKASGRSGRFVAVNVAGLDDELFSDALFGHVKGAFTGAEKDREGMLERARGGTILLDEVGDLGELSQIKLLRVLQEQEFMPVGADESRPLKARVVAATHKAATALREDLYFRLRAYQVELPPLRERLGDLPLLVDIFLESAAADLGREKPTIPSELFLDLSNEHFSGNIRELRSIVFDAVARHTEGVMPIELFIESSAKEGKVDLNAPPQGVEQTRFPHPMPTLKQIEQEAVREALVRVGDNRSAAARMLNISRPKILRHIAEDEEGAPRAD